MKAFHADIHLAYEAHYNPSITMSYIVEKTKQEIEDRRNC